jgi:hypothetical protein
LLRKCHCTAKPDRRQVTRVQVPKLRVKLLADYERMVAKNIRQ